MRRVGPCTLLLILVTAAMASSAIAAQDADLVVTNARIYTADGEHHLAEALAVRAALDSAGTDNPIQLRGNDGHHGGFNSAALARAADATGHTVGLTKATLAKEFARFRPLVGVDAQGQPNGNVDEEARVTLGLPKSMRLKNLMSAPQRFVEVLNRSCIVAIQDAAASADNFTLYDMLAQSGKLTVHVNAAQYFVPDEFRGADGKLDVARAVAMSRTCREKYASHPLIRADAVKIFADGVLEGDPNAHPPTPSHAARTACRVSPTRSRMRSSSTRPMSCGWGRTISMSPSRTPGVIPIQTTTSLWCRSSTRSPAPDHALCTIQNFIMSATPTPRAA